jgi:hypothetical protein
MNALQNIQNEAKVIVEQLADKQINEMLDRKQAFTNWYHMDGNAVMVEYYSDYNIHNVTFMPVLKNIFT